ncbi:YchO/YchP family invasin [Erwinia sp. CPCC 100877]|nr:YchO/YchP family invasin [Erwinia sp. CPCC 100877]
MRYPSFCTLTLLLFCHVFSGSAAGASFMQKAKNPFDNNGDSLPDLGSASVDSDAEKKIATMVKAFGEASMTDSDHHTGERARLFAMDHLRDALASRVTSEAESLLSPYGNADVEIKVDQEGVFTGSSGSLFTPWQDTDNYLTWSQVGFSQLDQGLIGNLGLGQRWVMGDWLLGYNTFYDNEFDDSLRRASIGTEAWGEYLRLSANYYHPLGDWRMSDISQQARMAHGYDITAQARLPFYRHINTSISLEQYFGDNVDLFRNGNGYRDPMAVKLGLSYTPIPLVTFTASHKQGEKGDAQEDLGFKLNYRFGVSMAKQLSADEVAPATSLRGSRYDRVDRSGTPILEFRQRKTLSVWLATPPWQLYSGDSVTLKIQIHSRYGIRRLSWQGDTQALSLTPPANSRSPEGWTVIIPAWDNAPEAENSWRLSVTVEDEKGQRVTSNWVSLKPQAPLDVAPEPDSRWQLLPDE